MSARLNLVLGAVLLAQIAAIAIRSSVSDEGAQRGRGLLLSGVESESLVALTVQSTSSAVHLTRQESKAGWQIEEASGYPADSSKVEATLRELLALEIADLVATSAQHWRELGVGEEEFERRLVLKSGDQTVTVLFGTSGRANSVHARRLGDDSVYALRNYASWKLTPSADSWLDRNYFEANRQLVIRAAVKNAHGEFRLQRRGGDWQVLPKGGPAFAGDADKVDALLGKTARVTMNQVAGRIAQLQGKLSSPVVELVLALRAPGEKSGEEEASPAAAIAETKVLRIAKKPSEEERYYLHREGSDFVTETSGWAVRGLLDAKAAELVPEKPSPGAKVDPAAD